MGYLGARWGRGAGVGGNGLAPMQARARRGLGGSMHAWGGGVRARAQGVDALVALLIE